MGLPKRTIRPTFDLPVPEHVHLRRPEGSERQHRPKGEEAPLGSSEAGRTEHFIIMGISCPGIEWSPWSMSYILIWRKECRRGRRWFEGKLRSDSCCPPTPTSDLPWSATPRQPIHVHRRIARRQVGRPTGLRGRLSQTAERHPGRRRGRTEEGARSFLCQTRTRELARLSSARQKNTCWKSGRRPSAVAVVW